MSSWDEQTGILERENGFVTIGYHCNRCEAYWQITMPQDDYDEAEMENELCYACSLRKRVAREIWQSRAMNRKALQIIQSMEKELDILLKERGNHESLLQSGSQIITQQDNMIRDLKKQLDRRSKKK